MADGGERPRALPAVGGARKKHTAGGREEHPAGARARAEGGRRRGSVGEEGGRDGGGGGGVGEGARPGATNDAVAGALGGGVSGGSFWMRGQRDGGEGAGLETGRAQLTALRVGVAGVSCGPTRHTYSYELGGALDIELPPPTSGSGDGEGKREAGGTCVPDCSEYRDCL